MSGRLPALRAKDVLRALERDGFEVHHVTGSHYILKHRQRAGLRVTIPWHNRDLKTATLRSIVEQAGYTVEDFRKLL